MKDSFVYLFGTIIAFFPIIFFYFFKKIRKSDVLIAGLILGLSSVITAYFFWTQDWWLPKTLLGTRIGVEDFILGFNTAAWAVIIHNLLFPNTFLSSKKNWHLVFSTLLIFAIMMVVSFYGIGISSFYSYVLAIITCLLYLYLNIGVFTFKTFLFASIYSVFSLPIYFILFYVSPGWFSLTWSFDTLSGILLFNFLPIEELVFWFLFGYLFQILYSQWRLPEKNQI